MNCKGNRNISGWNSKSQITNFKQYPNSYFQAPSQLLHVWDFENCITWDLFAIRNLVLASCLWKVMLTFLSGCVKTTFVITPWLKWKSAAGILLWRISSQKPMTVRSTEINLCRFRRPSAFIFWWNADFKIAGKGTSCKQYRLHSNRKIALGLIWFETVVRNSI